ncbi:MAG: hypothetical protein K0S76_1642 [Herbinix sp.]|jgi:N-acetylmuramoyl-L-alanine amidase|nr:hypothetical protein [Herbinix sp.]
MAKIKVAIDAGHGSYTAGKRTPPFKKNVDIDFDGKVDVKIGEQYREHFANVGVANLLYDKLITRGFDVLKTGWNDSNSKDDTDESLSSRQNKIKKAKCSYSISIHFNASTDSSTKFGSTSGVGIYIHNKYPEDSSMLANYIIRELVKGSKQTNRGISRQALAMCNCNTMKTSASILCELAFMTNEHEAQDLMANMKFWNECAEEIASGLVNYLLDKGILTPPGTPDPTKPYYEYYYVQSGDTLSKIATKHNTTVYNLAKLNLITDVNRIEVGQQLIVAQYKIYTVVKGDSLSKISKKFLGDSKRYKEIMTWNSLKSTTILVGQQLKIKV